MEFWKVENVKTKQSITMRLYSCRIVKLVEIVSALVIIFYSTTRLPIAVRIIVEFGEQMCALLLSTPSVFLIGNAIVVALVAQSGKLPGIMTHTQTCTGPEDEFYSDFVKEPSTNMSQIQNKEEEQSIDFDNSRIVSSEIFDQGETREGLSLTNLVTELMREPEPVVVEVVEVRSYRRTQSERGVRPKQRKVLRRSETENCGGRMKKVETVDDLSSDEFRRTVEDFIAKQQRFLRNENMAMVVSR